MSMRSCQLPIRTRFLQFFYLTKMLELDPLGPTKYRHPRAAVKIERRTNMKKIRGFLAGMITMALIFTMAGTAAATMSKITKELEYRDIKVSLDGNVLDLRDAAGNPVEPFMFEGSNYLPVRAMAETLGLDVKWDGSTATVVLTTPEVKKPVYITASGKRWHHDPHCNGGTYWEAPYASAVGMGLTPCDKCVHD